MKKLGTLLLVLITFVAMAQPSQEELKAKKEKMDAMKAAFMTEEMELTPTEAQKFWPIYNEMDKAISTLRMSSAHKMSKLRKKDVDFDEISDKELETMMIERLQNDEQIAKIKLEYHTKFINAIGVKKTAKMYHSEMRFARDLMRRMHGEEPPHGPHGSR